MTAKTVVEFLEGGDFCLAFVLELPASSRGAWEVLTQTGQTLRLSPGRVLVSQTLVDPVSKPERLAALAEIDRLRRELARTIQIEELWAVLEGEGPEFDYELLAGLAFGREPSADELSAVRRAVAADGLFFSFTPQTARRNTAEEAARKKLIRERQLARQAFLKESGTWIRDTLDGRLAPEPEGAEKAVLFLTNLAVQEEEAPDPRTAKEILKAAGLPENPRGAFAALAGLGRFSKHENLELLRLGLGQEFSPAELAAAEDIINKFQPDSGRLDLTGREVVTIDAAGAREFDDAISLQSLPEGRFELGLHIADVAAAVEPGSILDETARMRAASIYLPEAKYSMLPEKLTEKILSLKLGETRPAFSLLVELDPYGEPKKYSFKPTLIQVKKQMSFDEADRCLESDPFLSQCSRLGRILLNRRLEFGGQNLSLPQLQIRLGPGGEIRPEVITWDTPARLLVGEMMILANHLAAEALSEAGLACPYRCQEKPRGRHLMDHPPRTQREALAQSLAARRQVGRSSVSMSPQPHWGLGLTSYTQFTSPIRRCADLLVARQLRSLADPERAVYSRLEMMERSLSADELHRAIRKMQFSRQRYFLCLYLESRIGQEFLGLVFERQDQRIRICQTDFMLEFDMFKLPSEVRPGRDIRMRLAQADPVTQNIRFDYIDLA